MKKIIASLFAAATVVAVAEAQRTNIRIVGSSTVFPFATEVIEEFGATTDYEAPVMSSDGSGGGFKLFCAGVGLDHPDISNASSRQMSKKAVCDANGVEFTEFMVGYDGIVLANAIDGPALNISRMDLAMAVADKVPAPGCFNQVLIENTRTKWSDIDPRLPDVEIEVLGPPSTSGTRAAFEELVIQKAYKAAGCDKATYKSVEIRQDGHYIEAGENDSAIVDELEANPSAYGVFGYSFLANNADRVKGAVVDGVAPTFDNIAAGDYPVSRSLYFYVKLNHLGVVPGIEEYVELFAEMAEAGGELEAVGLIPGSEADTEALWEAVESL